MHWTFTRERATRLLEVGVTTIYFHFAGSVVHKVKGVPMGLIHLFTLQIIISLRIN